jgi:hypothetical protein
MRLMATTWSRPLTVIALIGSLLTQMVLSTPPHASATSPLKSSGLSPAQLEKAISTSATITALPKLVVPLADVVSDNASALARGCLIDESASTALGNRPANCDFGDVKSSRTMVPFGDSNAWMWLPAFNVLGRDLHFRVEFDARAGCEVAD